ncbi:hypothetical protein AVEN_231005-1 [Araneus ventricosus]|uniref:Uncharacterized protein n=1 Tax=Araneus ventricosus TaxID=182803 RepID=A0A4Y2A4C0_ARAVE|nr:hypothetical protein AVEN_231005-1 [Araneus ventricosus]
MSAGFETGRSTDLATYSFTSQAISKESLVKPTILLVPSLTTSEIYLYAQRQPNLTILSCSSQRNLSASSMTPNDVSFIPERNKSSSKIMDPNQ